MSWESRNSLTVHLMRGFTFRGYRIHQLQSALYIQGARLAASTSALCHRLLVLSFCLPVHEREKKPKEKERELGTFRSCLAVEPISAIMSVTLVPTDKWCPSIVMERRLHNLASEGLLRPITSLTWPEWIMPPVEDREPNPPEGYVVSFVKFHHHRFECVLVGGADGDDSLGP